MASTVEVHEHNEQSTAALIQGILADAQELMKQQLQLIQVEIKSDVRKTVEAGTVLACGIAISLAGAFLFGMTLVHLLYWLVAPVGTDPSRFPLWACYAIGTVVVAGFGALLAYFGIHRIFAAPMAGQAIQGLKENVEWKLDKK
jgi:hypothetical protein